MPAVDRTDRRLLLLIRLVVIPGFLAASYLTYAKLANVAVVCTGGCDVITNSRWSEVGGIPVTLLGMLTYVLIIGSTFVRGDLGKLAGAFFALVGAAFSIFLQYQALGVLKHFCPWCMTSAVCMVILAGLTVTRLLRAPAAEPLDD